MIWRTTNSSALLKAVDIKKGATSWITLYLRRRKGNEDQVGMAVEMGQEIDSLN